MCNHNILKRILSHDRNFGVYQDHNDGCFKIGRPSFKYNNKHVFVDGKNYRRTHGLLELLTKSQPSKSMVTLQDKQAYKQLLHQSNTHIFMYSPIGKNPAKRF